MSEQAKALTIVDKSTKAFATAAASLTKVAAEIGTMTEQVNSLTTEIEFKQSELNSLENQIETKQREAVAETKLRILEDEDQVLDQLMAQRSLAYISTEELEALQQQLADAQQSNQDAIDSAVKTAEKSAAMSKHVEISNLKSSHSVEVAEYKANMGAMSTRLEAALKDKQRLEQMLDDERTARVQAAQYSQANIQVAAPGK